MPHSFRLHTVAANRKIITHRVRKAYSCLLIEDHIKNAWLKCSFWSRHFGVGPVNEKILKICMDKRHKHQVCTTQNKILIH